MKKKKRQIFLTVEQVEFTSGFHIQFSSVPFPIIFIDCKHIGLTQRLKNKGSLSRNTAISFLYPVKKDIINILPAHELNYRLTFSAVIRMNDDAHDANVLFVRRETTLPYETRSYFKIVVICEPYPLMMYAMSCSYDLKQSICYIYSKFGIGPIHFYRSAFNDASCAYKRSIQINANHPRMRFS